MRTKWQLSHYKSMHLLNCNKKKRLECVNGNNLNGLYVWKCWKINMVDDWDIGPKYLFLNFFLAMKQLFFLPIKYTCSYIKFRRKKKKIEKQIFWSYIPVIHHINFSTFSNIQTINFFKLTFSYLNFSLFICSYLNIFFYIYFKCLTWMVFF
jgi:hypothetical protein